MRTRRFPCIVLVVVLVLVLASVWPAAVDDRVSVGEPASAIAIQRGARRLGRAASDTVVKGSLTFRTMNPEALERLLADQQDPASLNFRSWLTPEAFGRRFGVPPRIRNQATDSALAFKGGLGKLKLVRGGNTVVVVVDDTVSNAIRLTVPPA